MITEKIENIISGYVSELKKEGSDCFQYTIDETLYINSSVIPENKKPYYDFLSELIHIKIMAESKQRKFTKHDFMNYIEQIGSGYLETTTQYYPMQCAIDSLYMIAETMNY